MKQIVHEFDKLIPVTTELGDGYLLLLVNPGEYSNGLYSVVLCTGEIKWFTDAQFKVVHNNTLQIYPEEE